MPNVLTPPAVRERPILFSGPMVRATLADQKTQTRRVIQCPLNAWHINRLLGDWPLSDCEEFDGQVLRYEYQTDVDDSARGEIRCPFGVAGDRLWVRESFSYREYDSSIIEDLDPIAWYWADGNPRRGNFTKPKPSIHMPRHLSRITLEITGVRVERLQAITRDDAIAEGILQTAGEARMLGIEVPAGHVWDNRTSVENYGYLWNCLNEKRGYGWDVNPWVWVISFSVIKS